MEVDQGMYLLGSYTGIFVTGLLLLVYFGFCRLIRRRRAGITRDFASILGWCLLLQPALLAFCLYQIHEFAQTHSSLMLNANQYLRVSFLIFLVFELTAVYLAKMFCDKPGRKTAKMLWFSLFVSFAGAAVILLEAPKMLWPLTSALMLETTVPTLCLFGALDAAFGLLLWLRLKYLG